MPSGMLLLLELQASVATKTAEGTAILNSCCCCSGTVPLHMHLVQPARAATSASVAANAAALSNSIV